jgi:hypothetical protein
MQRYRCYRFVIGASIRRQRFKLDRQLRGLRRESFNRFLE